MNDTKDPMNTPAPTTTPDNGSEPDPSITPAPTVDPGENVIGDPTSTPDGFDGGESITNPLPSGGTGSTGTNTTTHSENTTNNNTTVIKEIVLSDTTPKTDVSTTVTLGKVVYKISGKAATVAKVSNKKVKSVTIRNSVKIGGKTLKVTKINKNAFKGCKKLKKVTIQAGSLKSIGKNAFKGIAKKAVIKVPKAKKKAYKKLLKKSKLNKTTKIK